MPHIAFLTVPRKRPYIHQTITSLIQADPTLRDHLPITILVDSANASYLSTRYETTGLAQCVPLSPEEAAQRAQWKDNRAGLLYNYWRCLKWITTKNCDLLLCEDDIAFAPHWLAKTERILPQIREKYGQKWILTLYSFYDWPANKSGNEPPPPFLEMPAQGFFGSQALWFTPETAALAEQYLLHEGLQKENPPADLRIRDCCLHHNIPLLSLTWSLVQHMGTLTTGQSPTPQNIPHTSPTFGHDTYPY